jgi:GNAT superfamily N-acetyltransferase
MGTLSVIPAGQLTLEAVADIFTRSFEAYFYPGTTTPTLLSRRVRTEQLDLWHSPVLCEDGQPVGLALIALRGRRAWCGGFGVYAAARGRGLSHRLADALLDYARETGAAELGLEVLTRNERAIRTYTRLGLSIWRDLMIYKWQQPDGQRATSEDNSSLEVVEADSRTLLAAFDGLHTTQAAWQRDLPSLLVGQKPRGLAVSSAGQIAGYLLFHGQDGGPVSVADLAARDEATAVALLQSLQRRATAITSVNEPSDSPITAAYLRAGFSENDRQHEMQLALN